MSMPASPVSGEGTASSRRSQERQAAPKQAHEPALSIRPSSKRHWDRLHRQADYSPEALRHSQPQTEGRLGGSARTSRDKTASRPLEDALGEAGRPLPRRSTPREDAETNPKPAKTREPQPGKRRQPKERARSASPSKEKTAEREPVKLRKSSDPTTGLQRSHTATGTERHKREKTPREAGIAALVPISAQNLKVDGIEELNTLLRQVFEKDKPSRIAVRSIMKKVHQIKAGDAEKFKSRVLQLVIGLERQERLALQRFSQAMELSEEEEGAGAVWISYGKALAHFSELAEQIRKRVDSSPVTDTPFAFVKANSQLEFS